MPRGMTTNGRASALAGQAQISRPDPPAQHDRPLLRRDRCQPLRQAHLAPHELKARPTPLASDPRPPRHDARLPTAVLETGARGAASEDATPSSFGIATRIPSDDPGRSRAARGWARAAGGCGRSAAPTLSLRATSIVTSYCSAGGRSRCDSLSGFRMIQIAATCSSHTSKAATKSTWPARRTMRPGSPLTVTRVECALR